MSARHHAWCSHPFFRAVSPNVPDGPTNRVRWSHPSVRTHSPIRSGAAPDWSTAHSKPSACSHPFFRTVPPILPDGHTQPSARAHLSFRGVSPDLPQDSWKSHSASALDTARYRRIFRAPGNEEKEKDADQKAPGSSPRAPGSSPRAPGSTSRAPGNPACAPGRLPAGSGGMHVRSGKIGCRRAEDRCACAEDPRCPPEKRVLSIAQRCRQRFRTRKMLSDTRGVRCATDGACSIVRT